MRSAVYSHCGGVGLDLFFLQFFRSCWLLMPKENSSSLSLINFYGFLASGQMFLVSTEKLQGQNSFRSHLLHFSVVFRN